MSTPLLLPSLSPTMEEGTIAEWHVKEGDFIESGTVLCSIVTDKTTVDYESLDEGYLRKIIVPAEETALVNQPIGILTDEADEDFAEDLEDLIQSFQNTDSQKPQTPEASSVENSNSPESDRADKNSEAEKKVVSGRLKASPLAKKIAGEKKIPLEELVRSGQIQGSGPGGRVIAEDLIQYELNPPAVRFENQPLSPAEVSRTKENTCELEGQALYGSLAPIKPTHKEVFSQMRKVIGSRLQESWQQAPSFFVSMKMNMDRLLELRQRLNHHPGYKISINDMLVKCASFALRQVPMVNATLEGDAILIHDHIDISVAVSLPEGLITPIIKNVDSKPIGQISSEIKTLVAKAKQGNLLPDEFQGGTFTISNLGMYGVQRFTSIINPPQVAILAVAGVHEELVRLEDGTIGDRKIMETILTADHRAMDGSLAAKFMQALKGIIENPEALML